MIGDEDAPIEVCPSIPFLDAVCMWDNGKMETTIVYWGYMRVMEKKMEITI